MTPTPEQTFLDDLPPWHGDQNSITLDGFEYERLVRIAKANTERLAAVRAECANPPAWCDAKAFGAHILSIIDAG